MSKPTAPGKPIELPELPISPAAYVIGIVGRLVLIGLILSGAII